MAKALPDPLRTLWRLHGRGATLADSVYQTLRAAIREGAVGEAEPLREGRLAARLAVSRTPVREALQRLTREGLIGHANGKGVAVPALDGRDLEEVYEIRLALEPAAAALAARGASDGELAALAAVLELAETARERDPRRLAALSARFGDLVGEASRNRRLAALHPPASRRDPARGGHDAGPPRARREGGGRAARAAGRPAGARRRRRRPGRARTPGGGASPPPATSLREGMTMTEASGLIRGLEGVVAAETQLCDLDGANGRLAYRGYDIADLARLATFEQVTYLLLHGELPKAAQLDSLVVQLTAARAIPTELVQAFRLMPKDTDPMRVLQAAVAILGMSDPDTDRQLACRQRPQGRAAHEPVRDGHLRAPPGAPGQGAGDAGGRAVARRQLSLHAHRRATQPAGH